MIIVVSGLTAVGKTTHAQLIAKTLDAPVVSATTLFRRAVGADDDVTRTWISEIGHQIQDARRGDHLDRAVDAELVAILREVRSPGSVVVDSWIAPWLLSPREDLLRIKLRSTFVSRVRKAQHSQGSARRTAAWTSGHVLRKDRVSRTRFQRMYHVDIFSDIEPFDIVLDNTQFSSCRTPMQAMDGIARFQEIFSHSVDSFAQTGRHESRQLMRRTYPGVAT